MLWTIVSAHREDAADHRRFRGWIEEMIAGPEAFGVAERRSNRSGRTTLEIFTHLCSGARAAGNLVADAYFAALAIAVGQRMDHN